MKLLTEDNLAVYRFRRVTFVIDASSFFLSATIHFHLNNYVENKELAAEMASNLYCGYSNGRHTQIHMFKSIYNGLKMNLRAFRSNNFEILTAISAPDRSSNTSPKVLGKPWDSIANKISSCVNVQREEVVGKRTIAQQIASVYNLFGWLIPLLVEAKHFQQFLRKYHYDWDQSLSEKHKEQWDCIVQDISEFRKELPRRVTQEGLRSYTLVTF
ncbi:unnamed protein product [Haemonchus placei]|uniref:Tyrosine-protein phosphatase domain-containing protein n=1 Tax=Haemonchus placei TaxID=6290 RepID=A0A0N4WTF7_HAEPC|nr:unnamed protein product [Haemonchus placei]